MHYPEFNNTYTEYINASVTFNIVSIYQCSFVHLPSILVVGSIKRVIFFIVPSLIPDNTIHYLMGFRVAWPGGRVHVTPPPNQGKASPPP